ncbi:hexokinase-2-like isoform X1 [Acipenser oxyrinchus oxyrinchus]|uniref:Phosphotransferase n=1 Tax=Acipenser oxyrinchus oxyrinchus TaxID=40147 RepID=A0AAD8CWL3_ACIOX|nr:hexokinase-2-like isoform X1 [Acipenser oxyrinchus oxyrinchus]
MILLNSGDGQVSEQSGGVSLPIPPISVIAHSLATGLELHGTLRSANTPFPTKRPDKRALRFGSETGITFKMSIGHQIKSTSLHGKTMNTDKTLSMPERKINRAVNKILQPFRLSQQQLCEISTRLHKGMEKGLKKKQNNSDVTMKMIHSFVRHRADRTENGDFLVVHVDGNVKVMLVELLEDGEIAKVKGKKTYNLPQAILRGTVMQLFDHLADCLYRFLDSQSIKDQKLPLGFSLAYPCEKGAVIEGTKGLEIPELENKNIISLLKEAISKRNDFNIGYAVVVNDVVATMMSCAYHDLSCEIGFIVDDGTNACYMEELCNEEGVKKPVCINTEWAAFGDDGVLDVFRTNIDKELDLKSRKSFKSIFEKMISGMYMGEIVRLILVKLVNEKLLFQGLTTPVLLEEDSFKTQHIFEIEKDAEGLDKASEILKSLGLQPSREDCEVVQQVCIAVSTRSAHLCAAGLATIANRIRNKRGLRHFDTTVAVDGTVYNEHPKFSQRLQEALRLLAPECDVSFMPREDSSGIGAAIVAGQELWKRRRGLV